MEKIVIGKPFNPSRVIEAKVVPATKIVLSCGGGMGGAQWDEYTRDSFDLNDKFISVNTNTGKNINFNTRNIVKTCPVQLVKVEVENLGNQYFNFKKIETRYYAIHQSFEVEFVDEYVKTEDKVEHIDCLNDTFFD